MDSTEKITLGKSIDKSSSNENMSLNAYLSGSKKILSEGGFNDTVDLYNEYIEERKGCNKFRLIVNINPFCTNVLFNPFTEIVNFDKNMFLNNKPEGTTGITGTIGKGSDGSFSWTAYDAIRDTQLSNEKCGFTYYCGLDIFNNHIIRNKTFKTVNYGSLSEKEIADYSEVYGVIGYLNRKIQQGVDTQYKYVLQDDFNTIDDYMRDLYGVIISDYRLSPLSIGEDESRELIRPLHLYQKADILTFEESVEDNLLEENGWFGFKNASSFDTLKYTSNNDSSTNSSVFEVSPNKLRCGDNYKFNVTLMSSGGDGKNGVSMDINKVINSKKDSDFIDMYPTRELFSFSPLYNERKQRYEKNWNYCLTYPNRSITKDFNNIIFPFFKELSDGTISLKVAMFDEYTVDYNGTDVLTIYSICQHGLKENDTVNIYKGDELVYDNGLVTNIVDKYIFQVHKESTNISKKWLKIDEINWENRSGKLVTTIDGKDYYLGNETVSCDNIPYAITVSNRCNVDEEAQQISFKRVLNNVECEYYVRVFARIPNFKFADSEINDYTLYGDNDLELIYRYSDPSVDTNDFENHISNTSFADTAYGDNDTEIVYTDDIDVSYLKDNLGRPLSEIFFTIVKNNKGYREWYSDDIDKNINNDEIEFSHCFGYNSNSFLFNDYYRNGMNAGMTSIKDVRDICAETRRGLIYDNDDELVFERRREFYGDICCYCPVECNEYSLQSVMNRFNTVQRELSHYEEFSQMAQRFNSLLEDSAIGDGVMFHDEIIDDEDNIRASSTGPCDFYKWFNIQNIFSHSSYHLDESSVKPPKSDYKYKDMLNFNEGYYYKMHYRIPIKTVSMSISKDNGINYDIFAIEKTEDGEIKIKTVYENDLTKNDKLILYNKTKNKFYYLTVNEIYTRYYFKCSVKNENLSDGFGDEINSIDQVSLIKRSAGTPEYAKIVKDGSCTYYWRNILSNGIEQNDSNIFPFTNGAFYVNRQINFFLRRQDPYKENLGAVTTAQFDYVPDGEELSMDFYDNKYYDSEEIVTC